MAILTENLNKRLFANPAPDALRKQDGGTASRCRGPARVSPYHADLHYRYQVTIISFGALRTWHELRLRVRRNFRLDNVSRAWP